LSDILFFIQVFPRYYNISLVSHIAPFVQRQHTVLIKYGDTGTLNMAEISTRGSAGPGRHARQWEAHAQLSLGYRLLLCGVGMSCGVDQ